MMKTSLKAGALLILLILMAGALMGCSCERQPEPTVVEPGDLDPEAPEGTAVTVTLYFSDDQAMYIMPEEREVTVKEDGDEALATAILEALIAGPTAAEHRSTMPAGSAVLGVEIADGLATVDLNKEFQTSHGGGSAGEYITLSSIANSLTELDSIDQVQLLIAGEKVDSLAGHFDLSEPLPRDEDAIGGY